MQEDQTRLRVKRIYDPVDSKDGARVLVDRLWPRGVRKDDSRLTLWLKDIAPSPTLRQWFDHDPAKFTEFAARYRAELVANPAACATILDLLQDERVTLLYAARDPACNHANVLAEYLREQALTAG